MPTRQLGKQPRGNQNDGEIEKELMEFHGIFLKCLSTLKGKQLKSRVLARIE